MKTVKGFSFYLGMLALIISCVTINIYFPAAAVEKAADEIVEEVWGEDEEKQDKNSNEPQSFLDHLIRHAAAAFSVKEVYAQEPDINVTTPAIRTLKANIQGRSSSVKPFMDRGNAGMTNDGLLVVRSTDRLRMKEKGSIVRLINAENEDRETLYLEIAKANNFSPEKVSDIKKIFAMSWIKKAKKGWWIQDASGEWRRKE